MLMKSFAVIVAGVIDCYSRVSCPSIVGFLFVCSYCACSVCCLLPNQQQPVVFLSRPVHDRSFLLFGVCFSCCYVAFPLVDIFSCPNCLRFEQVFP